MINSFELSGPGSSHGQTHRVVFLGETLNSHRSSPNQGVQMCTGKLYSGIIQ